MSKLDEILELYPDEEFISADGFDNAILGVDEHSMRLIYSVDKAVNELVENDMPLEDALDFFNFNIRGAYLGEKTPIWCDDM